MALARQVGDRVQGDDRVERGRRQLDLGDVRDAQGGRAEGLAAFAEQAAGFLRVRGGVATSSARRMQISRMPVMSASISIVPQMRMSFSLVIRRSRSCCPLVEPGAVAVVPSTPTRRPAAWTGYTVMPCVASRCASPRTCDE